MLDDIYKRRIRKMEEAGHFDEDGKCQYCDCYIRGITVFETEAGMRSHLEEEHGIKIKGW